MSRHKLVKNLDIDEELDDFDGDEDDYEEELTAEDKGFDPFSLHMCPNVNRGMCKLENLRRGTLEVRNTLGQEFSVTDREIEESLYYYYYDVPKTVNYILSRSQFSSPVHLNLTGYLRSENKSS